MMMVSFFVLFACYIFKIGQIFRKDKELSDNVFLHPGAFVAGAFVIWGLCRQGFCHAFIQDAMYFSVVFTVFLFTSLI